NAPERRGLRSGVKQFALPAWAINQGLGFVPLTEPASAPVCETATWSSYVSCVPEMLMKTSSAVAGFPNASVNTRTKTLMRIGIAFSLDKGPPGSSEAKITSLHLKPPQVVYL